MNMDQYIGRLLDNRYEILEIIGTGGMAVVYKARCHRLNRLVAIKILKDEFSRDEEFRRRFNAEGEAVAMLSHPNIVQVYDVSSSESANFIVMELIDGISLKQYMEKKGVLNWKETLHFAMQIAKGLEHAHSRGIVHRDIKPHNVMVLKNGSVKVMDFGIARVMSKTNTLTKEALGSVHYISPEQAKGGWVDNRSDLYSLSVVMYEMMSGRPPYDGESPVAVAIQHINGGARMPSTINPNIPGGLEQIIMKGMARDTKDRYASAAEMLRDMEEFRKNPMILFGVPAAAGAAAGAAVRTVGAPRTTAEKVAGQRTDAPRRNPAAARTGTQVSQNTARQRRSDTGAARSTAQRNTGNIQRRSRREVEAEEKKSRMTTATIVICSAVAVIAIVIFLIALMSGALFRSEMVKVPNLLGETYYSGMNIEGLIITVEHTYNSDYPKGTIFDQKPAAGSEVVRGGNLKVTVSMGEEPEIKYMENLVGQTEQAAKSFLDGQGMNPLVHKEFSTEFEEGTVIRTDPPHGTQLTDKQTVHIYVSKGPMIKVAKVPNVVGQSLASAKEELNEAGFENIEVKYVDSDEDQDEVLKQSIAWNTEIDVTTKIVLTVSNGPKETEPPTEKPTEKPTEMPTEKPTEGPTDPVEVTKNVSISLPEMEEVYVVSLYCNGSVVREDQQILPGTPSISVSLTGTGMQRYDVYINGGFYKSVEVEFN